MVKAESHGLYNNYDKLCDKLYELFKEVAKSKIADEEEGSVLYLIKRDFENPQNDRVLSLCKLKTLEYRLFRKMREKLKNYFGARSKNNAEALIKKFVSESRELIGENTLP